MWNDDRYSTMLLPVIVVVGVIIMGIVMAANMGNDNPQTITVQGTKTISVLPDEAKVQLSVENSASSAKTASSDNADTMADVMTALKNAGVANYQIKTVYLNVYPEYDYDYEPPKVTNYKAIHTIEITTKDTASVGAYIDAAVKAGANRVNDVQFSLSEGYQGQLRNQALEGASIDAKMKATAIAKGLGERIGEPQHVQATTSYIPFRAMSTAEVKSGGVPTDVQAGEVEFTVDVTIDFLIK